VDVGGAQEGVDPGRFAALIASHSVSMSFFTARASPVTTGPRTALAIACTASKSPGEEAGNPASMMSTLSASNCRAISIFCSLASFAPGTCSPSRSVVSKMKTFSAISCLLAVSGLRPAASALFPGKGKPPGRRSPGACDKNKNRGNLPVRGLYPHILVPARSGGGPAPMEAR
jgi:hypothetical protein